MAKMTIFRYMPEKSFETFVILLGLFIVMAEFFSFNSNFGFCGGDACLPKLAHYIILLVGIGLIFWGIMMFNPAPEEEWLTDWEE